MTARAGRALFYVADVGEQLSELSERFPGSETGAALTRSRTRIRTAPSVPICTSGPTKVARKTVSVAASHCPTVSHDLVTELIADADHGIR